MRAEPNGVAELTIVLDSLDVEGTHADAVRPDAEANAAARQLVLGEEAIERRAERRHVAHLAGHHDSRRQRGPCKLDELGASRC